MEKKTLQAINVFAWESITDWDKIEPQKQKALKECAGGIYDELLSQGFSHVREALRIHAAKQLCLHEGQFEEYLSLIYGKSVKTAYNRLETYKQLRAKYSEEQIAWLATRGQALMPYPDMPVGLFVRASKGLPAPKTADEETMSVFAMKVGERVKALRQASRQKAAWFPNKEAGLKYALNNMLCVFRRVKFRNEEEKREWFFRFTGMVLADQLLTEKEVVITPQPIPEGFKNQVGRPRKKRRSAVAAE